MSSKSAKKCEMHEERLKELSLKREDCGVLRGTMITVSKYVKGHYKVDSGISCSPCLPTVGQDMIRLICSKEDLG